MYILYIKSVAVILLSVVSIISGERDQRTLTDVVNATTLEGKVLFGYQGFFRRPGQGNDHWTIKGGIPGPSTPGDGKNSLPFVHALLVLHDMAFQLTVDAPHTLTSHSSVRHVPRSGTVSRRVPIYHQLHSSQWIKRLSLRIQLHRHCEYPFPVDAGEQHRRYFGSALLRRI